MVHFDHEIGRILQATGVAQELVRISEPAYIHEWRNAAGEILLRFGRHAASLSGWPESNMFSQPEFERLLDDRARSVPAIEVRRGSEVIGIHSGRDAVEIDVIIGDRRPRTVCARYIVGCDGANSFVRRQLGIAMHDLGFAFDWLVVDVLPNGPTTTYSAQPGVRNLPAL